MSFVIDLFQFQLLFVTAAIISGQYQFNNHLFPQAHDIILRFSFSKFVHLIIFFIFFDFLQQK